MSIGICESNFVNIGGREAEFDGGCCCLELLELPADALSCVLLKLGYDDLVRVGATCRLLQQVANDDSIWIGFCKPWETQVEITTWLSRMKSAKSLFRLLKSFNKLVGSWCAKQLGFRGALLYITWGDVSLEALRVLPRAVGYLRFVPLFQVVGMQDGTFRVELLTMQNLGNQLEVRLPGALVWPNAAADSFRLEGFELGHEFHRLQAAENENYVSMRLQGDIIERGVDEVDGAVIQPGRNVVGGSHICSQQAAQVCNSTYSRISYMDAEPGQELRGLWSGLYGPHGLEIVTVSYTKDDILATKIIGDQNVPSGEVTFYARLSTESSEVPMDLQSALAFLIRGTHVFCQLEKVYQGFGRVANYNFCNPRWVPGYLLVDRIGRMSFLWEDSFIIQFQRLDLPCLYAAQRMACASSLQAQQEH